MIESPAGLLDGSIDAFVADEVLACEEAEIFVAIAVGIGQHAGAGGEDLEEPHVEVVTDRHVEPQPRPDVDHRHLFEEAIHRQPRVRIRLVKGVEKIHPVVALCVLIHKATEADVVGLLQISTVKDFVLSR